MRYEDENIWPTQKMMATLYDVTVPAINQHIKKVFDDNELKPDLVIKNYLITAADGKQYDAKHYNLQIIIAVGFKVNSDRAVQFRKWAIIPMSMADWAKRLDGFLEFNGNEILTDAGRV